MQHSQKGYDIGNEDDGMMVPNPDADGCWGGHMVVVSLICF